MHFECQFEKINQGTSHTLSCKVIKTFKKYTGSKKISFIGETLTSHSTYDVSHFEILNQHLEAFPKNLHEKFPNLKSLHIINCGLEKISNEDLVGFKSLEVLVLDNNNLTTLPKNLFDGMANLRWIYFEGNKIEGLSEKLLIPILYTLKFADFTRNPGIDDYFDINEEEKSEVVKLMMTMMSSRGLGKLFLS